MDLKNPFCRGWLNIKHFFSNPSDFVVGSKLFFNLSISRAKSGVRSGHLHKLFKPPLIIINMAIGVTLLIVGIIVVVIWVMIELKRFKHIIWAMFLIALILFSYFGFMASIKGKDINFKSIYGLKTAGKLVMI